MAATVLTVEAAKAANSVLLGSTTNHLVAFYTNSTERMQISASGNVGIGMVPTGQYKLEVNGTINAKYQDDSIPGERIHIETCFMTNSYLDARITISAAADGVGARRSATRSQIVKSVSCPTPEIVGIRQAATARATISSLNGQRSSSEPPPRQIRTTS